jgi:hypothetical protein
MLPFPALLHSLQPVQASVKKQVYAPDDSSIMPQSKAGPAQTSWCPEWAVHAACIPGKLLCVGDGWWVAAIVQKRGTAYSDSYKQAPLGWQQCLAHQRVQLHALLTVYGRHSVPAALSQPTRPRRNCQPSKLHHQGKTPGPRVVTTTCQSQTVRASASASASI